MSAPLRVVHYVNQFFGGIGGEDQANVGVSVTAGAVGPGRALAAALGDGARIEATIVCGDNFASDRVEDAARTIGAELDRLKPDLLVAGPALAPLALRLGRGERLGPAEVEGYIGSGVRRVHDRGRPGYQRALDMLLDKLRGRPYRSEVPYAAPERVTPAPPIADLARARIAMVTTGGPVAKCNPHKQDCANAL